MDELNKTSAFATMRAVGKSTCFSMTDKELIDTLKKASESQEDNIALKFLLIMAAERIERHHAALFGTNP